MALRRSRILLAAVTSTSVLAGLAVAESSDATTPDTVAETAVATTPETAAEPSATTPDAAEVEILPPDESWGDMSRSEWAAQWWQRVLAMPEHINPYFDPTGERCGYQQSGPVFLLPGNFAGGMVERTCVVAEGTAIFVYVTGPTCGTVEPPPFFGRTEEELRACASALFDEITEYEAHVNDQDVANLEAYRTTSPMFTAIYPENNIFGVEPGVGEEVAESISFIIAPPPPGEYEITVSQGGAGVATTVIVEASQVIEPPTTEG